LVLIDFPPLADIKESNGAFVVKVVVDVVVVTRCVRVTVP
jgi:hypothetical protein